MRHSIVRTLLLVSGAAAGLMAGAGACSCTIGSSLHAVPKSEVASQISSKMTDGNGNKPDSVTCSDDLPSKVGAQVNCRMKIKNQTPYDLLVTVTSVNGNDVKFDWVETIDKNTVAGLITDKMGQQNGANPGTVTCPDVLKGVVGATLRCQLVNGNDNYGISVTVTSVDFGEINFHYTVDDQPSPQGTSSVPGQ